MGEKEEDAARKNVAEKRKQLDEKQKAYDDALAKGIQSAPKSKLDQYEDAKAAERASTERLRKAEERAREEPSREHDLEARSAAAAHIHAWDRVAEAWDEVEKSMGKKEREALEKAYKDWAGAARALSAAEDEYRKLEFEESKSKRRGKT